MSASWKRRSSSSPSRSSWFRSIIAADDLQPWKARVLLMFAMTITKDVTEIQQMFEHD
ncbi:hypothetical protein FB388_2242 [Pseudonocardia cypriaca]|uniref:Uncharacterized protein n=1 Tax=Pseudonocardia cypriaca TaxID=882449 RepID=A0A543GFN1_9PSEU|nr:hypothetical protein FB388_2242 [Pseudonocardia cypriaca]